MIVSSLLFGCKVLVTGATGFLGSHLTSRLCESGADVHAVSRSQRSVEANGPRWWHGDMAEIATVRELFHEVKPDVVFHLSGLATASPDRDLVLPTFHSLLVSTVNILMAAAENRSRRIVLAASLTEPQSGHSEITPGSPYAAAKWASGAYARMFHGLYDVPVVMVRPFMTYGPAQDHRKLIPHVILSLLRGEAPKLSSAKQQFDWIYIDDVVDGLLAAGKVANVEGCTIDLGSGVAVPVYEIVKRLTEVVGARVQPLFGAVPDRPLEWARIADTQEAFIKLGWQPRTSLEKGMEHTVAWYRHHHESTKIQQSAPSPGFVLKFQH